MGTTYWEAPEVAEIAAKLIDEHHPELADLRIEYIFRSPASASGGRIALGKAKKITGLAAFLAHHDGPLLVMEIAGDAWADLSERKRQAVVDHELCHMGFDDNGVPIIVPHDVEEFVAVVERHGIWTRSLESFQLAVQLALPFAEEPGPEGTA